MQILTSPRNFTKEKFLIDNFRLILYNKIGTKEEGGKQMQLIISIISFLVGAYISYYIFEKHGFLVAWTVNAVIQLISTIFQNGVNYIFASIVGVVIGSLIGTAIEYFVYQKTNSFWGYVGGMLLLGIVIAIILVLIGVWIAGSATSGILSAY